MTDLNKAVFCASIPDFITSLKFGSTTPRIQLDVWHDHTGEAAKLIAIKGERLLRVTVEVMPESEIDEVIYGKSAHHDGAQEFEEPYKDILNDVSKQAKRTVELR